MATFGDSIRYNSLYTQMIRNWISIIIVVCVDHRASKNF